MKKMIIFFCALFAFANLCFGARITSDTLELTANPSGTPSTSDKSIQFGVTASANKGCIEYVYATPRVRLSQDCSDYVALLAESGALGVVGTSANGSTDVLNLKDSGESEVFAVDTDGNTEIQGNFIQPLGKYFDIGTGSTANTLSVNGIVALKYGGPAIGETGFSKLYGQTDDQLYFTPENDETATLGMEKAAVIGGNRTLNSTDRTIIVDPSSNVTLTLPAAATNINRVYNLKASDLDYTVTVDANSTELIDGQETYKFRFPGEAIKIISDGTSWHIQSTTIDGEDYQGVDVAYQNGFDYPVALDDITVTNGGANTTLSKSVTSSSIDKAGSLRITKTAADGTGDYVDIGTWTTNADTPVQNWTIRYMQNASSGFDDGDWQAVLYDGTTEHEFSDPNVYAGTPFFKTFQTPPGSGTWTLRLKATSETDGFTYDIDNFQVSKTLVAYGAVVTDWESYTPTLNSLTSVSSRLAKKRRVGGNLEVIARISYSGVGNASAFTMDLGGLSIDTSKLPNPTAADNIVGIVQYYDASATDKTLNHYAVYDGTTSTVKIIVQRSGYSYFNTDVTGNGDTLNLKFSVPIVGWGAQTQLGADAGNRRVFFRGRKTSNEAVTADTTDIAFASEIDDAGGWTGTTWKVPFTDDYDIGILLNINASASFVLYVNGDLKRFITQVASGITTNAFITERLNYNDIVSIRSNTNGTVAGSASNVYYLNISNKGRSSAIFEGEKVETLLKDSSGQTITNGATITFDSVQSSHNNFLAGVYTVKRTGTLRTGIALFTSAVTPTAGHSFGAILVNGSTEVAYTPVDRAETTANRVFAAGGNFAIPVTAGDQIKYIFTSSSSFSAATLLNDGKYNNAYFFED